MELALLENIYDCASDLIQVYPSLRLFDRNLSTQDLVQWTSAIHSESSVGKPVSPPTEFISEVKRVVSHKEWTRLSILLEKWNELSAPGGESRLSTQEHEYLTMGVLWETLVITKCKGRYDEIQKEISAISADNGADHGRHLQILS